MLFRISLLAVIVVCAGRVSAQQRVQFPSPTYPGTAPGPSSPVQGTMPSVTLGQQIQPFDPYAVPSPQAVSPLPAFPNQAPLATSPSTPGPLPQGPFQAPQVAPPPVFPSGAPLNSGPPTYVPPAGTPPSLPPNYGAPPTYGASPGYAAPPYGAPPTYGLPPYSNQPTPIQPAPVFPDGFPAQPGSGPPYQRLFQNTGFLYAWTSGDPGSNPNAMQINEIDIFTTAVLNNFAYSPAGLRLTPGFTFDFLSGPSNGSDMPAQLYAAYLDAFWRPQLTPQFAAALNFRTGVYSDFNTVTSDSVRFMGTGLGVLQLTPTLAFKLGVEYLDRVDIKLLPAGGVLWTPNPQTKFDIYFPRPKLMQYWTTIGNTEIWWHLGGEYGTGSWTIERTSGQLMGFTDRVDINDIEVFGGVELNRLDRIFAVFEVGYVFNRKLVYDLVPADNTNLDDAVMVRAGLHF